MSADQEAGVLDPAADALDLSDRGLEELDLSLPVVALANMLIEQQLRHPANDGQGEDGDQRLHRLRPECPL